MAVLLAAFMSCEKTSVNSGNEDNTGTEEPVFERMHKNKLIESSILKTKVKYSIFLPASYEEETSKK